jgi:hypothetical protein
LTKLLAILETLLLPPIFSNALAAESADPAL